MAELTLAQLAEITLRLERGEARQGVLSTHGLTEEEWIEQQMMWLSRMAAQVERDRYQLYQRYLHLREDAQPPPAAKPPWASTVLPVQALAQAATADGAPRPMGAASETAAPKKGNATVFNPVAPPPLYATQARPAPQAPPLVQAGIGQAASPPPFSPPMASSPLRSAPMPPMAPPMAPMAAPPMAPMAPTPGPAPAFQAAQAPAYVAPQAPPVAPVAPVAPAPGAQPVYRAQPTFAFRAMPGVQPMPGAQPMPAAQPTPAAQPAYSAQAPVQYPAQPGPAAPPAPVAQYAPQPVAQYAPQPVAQYAPQPVAQYAPQPAAAQPAAAQPAAAPAPLGNTMFRDLPPIRAQSPLGVTNAPAQPAAPNASDPGAPRLALQQLALLVADLMLYPERSVATLEQSGLDQNSWNIEWSAWQARFASNPEERQRYDPLVNYYTALRRPPGEQR